MTSLIARLKAAWASLLGRERVAVLAVEGAAEAELRRLHIRLKTAALYLKETLPMALIDDINALGTAIDNALAAKDTAAAGTVAQLAAATATIADRDKTISDADAAVNGLTAKITPAPQPQVDPNTGLPVQ